MEYVAIVEHAGIPVQVMGQLGRVTRPKRSLRFSIGDRSGDLDGQSSVLTGPACKQFLAILQVWGWTLSCCKRKWFPTIREIGRT